MSVELAESQTDEKARREHRYISLYEMAIEDVDLGAVDEDYMVAIVDRWVASAKLDHVDHIGCKMMVGLGLFQRLDIKRPGEIVTSISAARTLRMFLYAATGMFSEDVLRGLQSDQSDQWGTALLEAERECGIRDDQYVVCQQWQ